MKATEEIQQLAARWHAQLDEPLTPRDRRRLFAWVTEFADHHRQDTDFTAKLAIALGLEEDAEWPSKLLDGWARTGVECMAAADELTEAEHERVLLLFRTRQLEAEVELWKARARHTADLFGKAQPMVLWSMWWADPVLDRMDRWAPIIAWMQANGWQESYSPHTWLGAPARGWKRSDDARAFVVMPGVAGRMVVWKVICELSKYTKRNLWDVLDEVLALAETEETEHGSMEAAAP
jgi:hypothetical protein